MDSENLNISLGLELDKNQFSQKNVQGQVDKSVGNIKVKVGNVQFGDISKQIQGGLDKDVKRVKVQLKDVFNIDSNNIDSVIKTIESSIEEINSQLSKTKIDNLVDEKGISRSITNTLKQVLSDAANNLNIDFSKISVTGITAATKDVINALKNDINIKLDIDSSEVVTEVKKTVKMVEDTNVKVPVDIVTPENNETIISGIDDYINDVEGSEGFKVELDISISEESKNKIKEELNELGKQLSIPISRLDIKDNSNTSEYNNGLKDELTKVSGVLKDIDVKDINLNINTYDAINKISKIREDINILNESIEKNKIFKIDSKNVLNKIENIKTRLNEVVKELKVVKPIDIDVDIAITSETRKSIDNQLEALSDILELTIQNIDIVTDDKIKNNIKKQLEKSMKSLSISLKKMKFIDIPILLIKEIEFATNIHNKIQKTLNSIMNEVKANIKNIDIDEKAVTKSFDKISKNLEKSFKGSMTGVIDALSQKISTGLKVDFSKAKVVKIKSKASEISKEINDNLKINPKIETNNSKNPTNSTSKDNVLNNYINDIPKSLKQLENKKIKLNLKLDDLFENGVIEKNVLDGLKKDIKSMNLSNVDSSFNNLLNTLNKLAKSESQIVRISNAIQNLNFKLVDLNSKSKSAWETDTIKNQVNEVNSYIQKLKTIQSDLINGKSIDKNSITSTINKLNLEYKNLKSSMDNVISNENKINKLETKLTDSLGAREFLGSDTTYTNELLENLKSVSVESTNAKVEINDLTEQVRQLGKSDSQIRRLQDAIKKLENEIKNIEKTKISSGIIDQDDFRRLSEMKSELNTLEGALKSLENGASLTREEVQRMCNNATESMRGLANITNDVDNVFSGLGSTINRGMQAALGFEFIDIFTDQIRDLKDGIVELDNEMVGLKRVTNETSEVYDNITKSSNQTAISMGKTTQEVINATTEFVKMGYSVREASDELSIAGLTLSNVAEMNISESVDAIVSTMKGFGYEADKAGTIVDVINEAGNKFALNSKDLAEGIRIGAASLSIAGNDLYEASALITAGTEVLQDPAKVANGLKTISMRLRGVASDGEELNPKLQELIKTMTGVDLTKTNGEFRSTYEILLDIGNAWDKLNSKQQALLLDEIAGKTQANVLASILKNVKTLDDSYEVLANSASSAEKEQAAYMDSIAGKANALKESFKGLFYDMIDSNAIKSVLTSSNSLINTFRDVSNILGPIPTLVATVTTAFTLFSDKGRELASTVGTNVVDHLSLMSDSFAKVEQSVKLYTSGLQDNINNLKNNINAAKEYIRSNRDNAEGVEINRKNLKNWSQELTVATVKMTALKVATTGLNAVLMGLSGFAISAVITGATSLFDKLIVTTEEASRSMNEFKGILESTKDQDKAFIEFGNITKELEQANISQERQNELNKELEEVKKRLYGVDDTAYSILNNQNLSYERQLELIKEIQDEKLRDSAKKLDKDLSGGLFKEDQGDVAQKAANELQNLVDKYKEMETALSESTDEKVKLGLAGVEYSAKYVQEEMDKTKSSIEQSLGVIDKYDSQVLSMGEYTQRTITNLGEETRNAAESIIGSKDVMDQVSSSIGEMGVKAEETTTSIKKLTDSFSAFSEPLELLNQMVTEFQKFGGLTDETYEKVLSSGNEQLIGLLANSKNFLENAKALREELKAGQEDAALQLIDTCAENISLLNEVSSAAEETSATTSEKLTETTNATKEALTEQQETLKSQIEALKEVDLSEMLGSGFDGIMNGLIESLNMGEDEIAQFEELVLAHIAEYVNQGAELYAADAINKEEFDRIKAESSKIWSDEQFNILANHILENQNLYSEDEIAWANNIANKIYDSSAFSDETIYQIANMVIANAENYNEDTVAWAMALTNKDQNHINMINAMLTSMAQMILANSEYYGADATNWANAILSKDGNNGLFCSNVSGGIAGLINFLASEYGKDAQNFASSTSSKIQNLRQFIDSYNKVASQTQGKAISKYTPVKVTSSYNGVKSAGSYVSKGSNYVPSVGSSSGKKKSTAKKKSSGSKGSSTSKDVEDMESLVDRYYAVENALKKVENQLDLLDTELDDTTGKDRIKLLEKEIKLLADKKNAFTNLRSEQQQELNELRKTLSSQGFSFASDGTIANYENRLNQLTANANKKTGDAKKEAISNVKEVAEKIKTYTDLLLNDIPETTSKINGIAGSISDIREEIGKLIEETTFYTKDFVDRYYEVNNALQKVENQLNAISTTMDNASDDKLMELLDKQIQLYIEQGKALSNIRKENVEELNELGKELYDAGFKFNKDGSLANYESLIDNLVQNANKITDGKKQEKEINRIEKLVETIEKYTDLLLTDIPEITDDMNDLSNQVIDSQKEIADILSKQKDKYIENLEKETEALKTEIEKRKNLLEKQWEQEDSEDELAEKQKTLNELEDQLTVALRVGDEELIKNIREQISSAQKELNDFIRDQERDFISNRFDEDLDKIDKDLESKIETIESKLSDEELLNLVQSGVRDLTEVLNKIENESKGVRSVFAAIGITISETWISALDTVMDQINSISNVNLDFGVESKLAKVIGGFERTFNINQGNLIVEGNVTEDVLPIVQDMIDRANSLLVSDINRAFSR